MFPVILSTIALFTVFGTNTTILSSAALQPREQIVAEKAYSMTDRYGNTFVNDVFADNILLTMAYMRGITSKGQTVDWSKVESDFTYSLTLQPGEIFAFHDQVLPEYKGKVTYTTNAHFDSTEGFKSDGWLVADGVCHLASFLNVVAKQAGLTVVAPTNHDFANIPDVPRGNGTAIYYMPGQASTSELQNLYITNNFDVPVTFVFTYKDKKLDIVVEK